MSTDTENKLPTLEEATKRLEDLKKEIDSSNPAKHGIPENIQRLTPSRNQKKIKYFGQSSAYGVRINKEIKDKFKNEKHFLGLKLQKPGPTENGARGANIGQIWHEIIHRYLKNKSQNSYEKDVGAAVINALKVYKSTSSMVKNIEILQSKFPLYGFMTDQKNSEFNFWNGEADAIGWFEGHYVIVEWKVVVLPQFWAENPLAYGDHVHQCLVYARLLQLHLGLEKLPYILIVPICKKTGNNIHPALFRYFPDECKKKIEKYKWSIEFNIDKKKIEEYKWSKNSIDVDTRFLKQTYTEIGVVSDECVVNDLFMENITVRQLLEALRFKDSKLNVVREDSRSESSLESSSE